MFTGIIVAVGQVSALERRGGDVRLSIDTGTLALSSATLGDSIAVNGVCLTAVALASHSFSADVSNETLSRTTLAEAKVGTAVNLELALMPSTRMGGHIVSGHVDGIGTVQAINPDGRSFRFTFAVPDGLAKYIAEKGSICIDGISLTVNQVAGATFGVNVVPHTRAHTTLGQAKAGDKVNIEVDLVARYLERLLLGGAAEQCAARQGVTTALLVQSGFLK